MGSRQGTVLPVVVVTSGIVSADATWSVAASQETTAAQRCFEHHRFGAQPVDIAKSADGQTVLARGQSGWHDSIGCYLTLDDTALTTLRASYAPGMGFTSVTAGASHSCGIRTDQIFDCWGRDSAGQSGAPYGIFTAIAAGGSHSCEIRTDEPVTC